MLTRLNFSLFVVFLHLSALVLAEESIVQEKAISNKSVYFPQFKLFQTVKDETDMLYEIAGKLILKNECLRVVSGSREYLVIWPGWYEFDVIGREIAVKHLQKGFMVGLKVGDTVKFSGAELENNPINLQFAIPDQCPGPYWAVGEIVSVIAEKPVKNFQFKTVKKRARPVHKQYLKAENTGAEIKDSSKKLINFEIKLEDSMVK
ncbi:MAG: hypothetical protein IPN42_10135 [Methylococcaceae bacterium]|nr:hypothetical protein [Methylococcaceae bacterium]